MTGQHDDRIRELLGSAMPPMGERQLDRDLWPRMLCMLDRQPRRQYWFDVVLAALAAAWFLIYPEVIPAVLYQL